MYFKPARTLRRCLSSVACSITGVGTLVVLAATPASAYYGDCGQPHSDGDNVHVSDALYLLHRAVGNPAYPAPLCVGDVNSDAVVSAADAGMVQAKAVGQSVTLLCPAGSVCTSCSNGAIYNRLVGLVDGERVLAGTSTIFRCPQAQTLTMDANCGAFVNADNVIVSGRDRDITFQASAFCPAQQPSVGRRFLDLVGDNIVLRDMRILRFWNNIEVSGDFNTIQNVEIEGACDAGLLTRGGATGTEMRDSVITRSGGKGVRVTDTELNTASECLEDHTLFETSGDRHCYNFASFDSDYLGVETRLRLALPVRVLVKGGRIASFDGWPCNRALIENQAAQPSYLRLDAVELEACASGVDSFGRAGVVLDNAIVNANSKRGALTHGGLSFLNLDSSSVTMNGGTHDSQDQEGGIVSDGSYALLASPAPGQPGNLVCGNQKLVPSPVGGSATVPWQLAELNGGSIDVDPGNAVSDSCP